MNIAAAFNMNPPNYGSNLFVRNDPHAAERGALSGVRDNQSARNSNQINAPQQLTLEEEQQVRRLQAIDREVRAHERAHIAVGGSLVRGGAAFTYETGPDRVRYAVGGEVSIDVSPGRDAEESVVKGQRIQAAALAPANPSAQDRSVAAHGRAMEVDARAQLAREAVEKLSESSNTGESSGTNGANFYRAVEESYMAGGAVGRSLDIYA